MGHHEPADSSADQRRPPFRRIEQAMMASVNAAIRKAAGDAHDEDADIAKRLPPHYFQRAALQLLFLQVCGADSETFKGGDPGVARRLLHVGRTIASQWDDGGREPQYEPDNQQREDLAKGAQRAALKIVLQALVEHASASDPNLRDRISAAADAYVTGLAPQSVMENQFAELTRGFVSIFAGMPAGQESR